MTAAWKQKKFERLAQKDLTEKLKNEVAQLTALVDQHKAVNKMIQRDVEATARQRDEYSVYARRYLRLRKEELMIATPDGFKLVTGDELDIHCGSAEEKLWWGQPIKPMTYTISADDALDAYSLTHAQHMQISEKFQRALEQSMLQTKEAIKESIYVLNTRSKSEETNQEDS